MGYCRVKLVCLAFGASLLLSACSSFDRADAAAEARRKMVGMGKEDVLACMGPPRQNAHVGATEVWTYRSTEGAGTSTSIRDKIDKNLTLDQSYHERNFCTINIVMKNGVVAVVHYNGPRSGFMARDEQCGFAVEHCVE